MSSFKDLLEQRMWNLNRGLRGPISSLDVASLLKSDHVAAISNDYLALPKARQDVLKVAKHEALPKLPTFVHTFERIFS